MKQLELNEINTQVVLRWPWGLWNKRGGVVGLENETKLDSNGGLFLFNVAHRDVRGSAEPLWTDGNSQTGKLLDIAYDVTRDGSTKIRLNHDIELNIEGHAVRPKEKGDDYDTHVDHWSGFFEELYYAERDAQDSYSYSWNDIRRFINESHENPHDAKLALIVEIAQKFTASISELVSSMSPVLKRERTLQSITQAKEFDNECVKWISKLPGETIRQKIGSQKNLLSIKRFKNFDSFHNRILKDFLIRCERETKRYVSRTVRQFSHSPRVICVRSFGHLCGELLEDPNFDNVGIPNLSDPPDYVILHNARYRKVWNYYLRLLKLQDERDDLWKWQNRTWGEIAKLLISVCLYDLSEISGDFSYSLESLLEGEPSFNHQQIRGARLEAGTEPGPFLLSNKKTRSKFILDLVSIEAAPLNEFTNDLLNLGCRMFLVFNPVDSPYAVTPIVGLWTVNSIISKTHLDIGSLSRSLDEALENINGVVSRGGRPRKVFGIVFVNAGADFDILHEGKASHIVLCPENFHKWASGLKETLPLVLDSIIERLG